jgi:hypothetical protein
LKILKKPLSISSASSTLSEDDDSALESDIDEDDFELIEYFDSNSNQSQNSNAVVI